MHSVSALPTVSTVQAAPVVHSVWMTSIRFTLVTALLLGLGYPLLVTGIARVFFPHQAAGSLILKNGQIVGSGRVSDMTKDEVLGMIILGKCPPGAIPGPGAMES